MKRIMRFSVLGLAISGLVLIHACNESTEDELDGNWMKRSSLDGNIRSSAVVFVVDQFAYVGTGFNGQDDDYYADFWRYDPSIDSWNLVDTFPGAPRSSAVAFSIGTKGYVGTGYDGDDELKDFWSYDTETDEWTDIASFPGSARRGAVAFAVGGKGYVGTGYDGSNTKDFYEYDPTNDSWRKITSILGEKRVNAAAFVINDKAYVGTGTNNGVLELDFFEFDPLLADSGSPWKKLTALDDDDDYSIIREGASAFAIDGLGYITTGSVGSLLSTTWEYDPVTDLWEQRTSLEASARIDAIGFTVANRGYVAMGRNSSFYFDDIWELHPQEEQVDND
ncbi:MAG: galactose oxidase [Cyclobacteriaceae bacterium]|nr:galactose oxidase [Cyclobacteriaceae bacterium HetDA_MAG_MS6]